MDVSVTTVCRRLHKQNYTCYTARCKPLVSYKNRMAKLQFVKKYLKVPGKRISTLKIENTRI